jgi:hypothetical protein
VPGGVKGHNIKGNHLTRKLQPCGRGASLVYFTLLSNGTVVNRVCTVFFLHSRAKKVWEVRRRENKEIAESLCISVKTVEKHRANLMKKLSIHNIQALTTLALEKGLVSKE